MTGSQAGRKPTPQTPSGKVAATDTASLPSGKKRGWDEIESLFSEKKKQKQEAAKKPPKKHHSKSVAAAARPKQTGSKDDWVDDGLGGVHNAEGYTGRVEDGVKIFKAHVLKQPNAGYTESCPFDCKCCYI